MSNCTECVLDMTDACSRRYGRSVEKQKKKNVAIKEKICKTCGSRIDITRSTGTAYKAGVKMFYEYVKHHMRLSENWQAAGFLDELYEDFMNE